MYTIRFTTTMTMTTTRFPSLLSFSVHTFVLGFAVDQPHHSLETLVALQVVFDHVRLPVMAFALVDGGPSRPVDRVPRRRSQQRHHQQQQYQQQRQRQRQRQRPPTAGRGARRTATAVTRRTGNDHGRRVYRRWWRNVGSEERTRGTGSLSEHVIRTGRCGRRVVRAGRRALYLRPPTVGRAGYADVATSTGPGDDRDLKSRTHVCYTTTCIVYVILS